MYRRRTIKWSAAMVLGTMQRSWQNQAHQAGTKPACQTLIAGIMRRWYHACSAMNHAALVPCMQRRAPSPSVA